MGGSLPFVLPRLYEPHDNIAELILRQGQIAADRQARSGEIWGNTIANLGQQAGQAIQQHAEQSQVKKQTQAIQQLFSGPEMPKPEDIIRVLGPKNGIDVIKGLNAIHPSASAQYKDRMEQFRDAARGVLALPTELRPHAYDVARGGLIRGGVLTDQEAPAQYDESLVTQVAHHGEAPAKPQGPLKASPGDVFLDPQTFEQKAAIPEKAPKPPSLQHVETAAGIQSFNPESGTLGPVLAKGKPSAAIVVNSGNEDVKAVGDAIISGQQPPETKGLYRFGPGVRAYLAKQGYNLAQAETDWRATQKHVQTLNGAQQTRMAQAIDNAAHSLDVIDGLADQWKGGNFPLLNKAKLAVAKGGALGPKAQAIATQLEAQIADVTSELGNVYMGGNSPTDHSLALAARNLSADWSESQLRAMTKLSRTNLQIRQNSMRNVGVAGASAGNPYAAPAAPATAPSPAGGAQAPKVGDTKTFPNGKTATWDGHGWFVK